MLFSVIQDFITPEMISSTNFQQSVNMLVEELTAMGGLLGKHSVPFFSPRYAAHMNSDISRKSLMLHYITHVY